MDAVLLSGRKGRNAVDGRLDDDIIEEARSALDGLRLEEIEIRVASLVARNRTNERIAEDLGVPLSRVKWVLHGLFKRLGVPDRHGLADLVDSRLSALRKREARRRPAPRQRPAELRLVEKPRRTPRARRDPGPPRAGGEPRTAPSA
jgi:DNA-binding CsgD family transcriptional regulator